MSTTSATPRKVAFLVANEGIERVELVQPWQAVEKSGAAPVLLAPKSGTVSTMNHLDKAEDQDVDLVVADAGVGDFDALVLPGGVANPDALRMDADAVAFVREFMASGKPVAAICHAPWSLIEADAVRGRTLTSWPSLATDLRNAGAHWRDEQVVVCTDGPGPLITSRKPDDLDAFCTAVVEHL